MHSDSGMTWGKAASFRPWRATLWEGFDCEPSANTFLAAGGVRVLILKRESQPCITTATTNGFFKKADWRIEMGDPCSQQPLCRMTSHLICLYLLYKLLWYSAKSQLPWIFGLDLPYYWYNVILLFQTVYNTMMIHAIVHLSKPVECTTPSES